MDTYYVISYMFNYFVLFFVPSQPFFVSHFILLSFNLPSSYIILLLLISLSILYSSSLMDIYYMTSYISHIFISSFILPNSYTSYFVVSLILLIRSYSIIFVLYTAVVNPLPTHSTESTNNSSPRSDSTKVIFSVILSLELA